MDKPCLRWTKPFQVNTATTATTANTSVNPDGLALEFCLLECLPLQMRLKMPPAVHLKSTLIAEHHFFG